MKKILIIIFALCVLNVAYADVDKNTKKILISQVVEHPALNKTVDGILAGLRERGFVPNQNLSVRIESAQANSALALQIANKFTSQKPDVVVGVGTISAQSFVKSAINNGSKLVFSSVTDPLSASLKETHQKRLPNITGVSNFVPLEPQLKMFKRLQPNLQSLGIIYNPGEINSVSIVQKLEKVCATMQIKLVKSAVTKTSDVAQAATRLAANVDAIFISNDNMALCSLQVIIAQATKARIPVYVSDTDAITEGALAALGPNQFALGKQTGYMIARILQGEDIATISDEIPMETNLVINLTAAQTIGMTVPKDVLDNASSIIGEPK